MVAIGALLVAGGTPLHADETDERRPDFESASPGGAKRDQRGVRGGDDAAAAEGAWREPNRLLPAGQIALGLTFGGLEYWVRNHPPRLGLSSWSDRVSTTEWLVLDEDPFVFNYSYHALAGAGYHLAARTSDLGMFEAALLNLGSSIVWEYVVEYDQSVDFNDLIFTSPAGLALGEFGHALGRLLQQAPAGRRWQAARWTLGLGQSFNDELRGVDGPRGPEVAARFSLSTGASLASGVTTRGDDSDRARRVLTQLRLSGRLARIDDPYPAGVGWRRFADGNFTSLDAALTAGTGGYAGTYVLSDTFLAGWRYTDIAERDVRGRALNLGLATAFRYRQEQFGDWRDRFAAAHLPGLAADAARWGPSWRLEGLARVHADYGGIGALSHRRWAAENPSEVGWSSLAEEGYYHAFGVSARLRAELISPLASVGAELFGGRYRNHDGRDLREPELTTKQRISSRALDYDLWLRKPFANRWFLEARAGVRYRWERFEDLDARARILRTHLAFGGQAPSW